MSDFGRKGLGDQAKDKVTPDSQKSTLDKAGETLSGAGDRVAGAVQPEGQKSTTQKMGDATRSGHDDASNKTGGMMENVSNTISDTFNSVTGGQKK